MALATRFWVGSTPALKAWAGGTLLYDDTVTLPAPALSGLTIDDATDTVSLHSDTAGRLYWRAQTPGTDPDAATIVAGGGLDSGFVDIASGTVSVDIDVGATGTVELHYVLAAGGAGGTLSNVVGGEITINEAASDTWAFTGSTITNLPATEGWAFTGSTIDTIPEAAA